MLVAREIYKVTCPRNAETKALLKSSDRLQITSGRSHYLKYDTNYESNMKLFNAHMSSDSQFQRIIHPMVHQC